MLQPAFHTDELKCFFFGLHRLPCVCLLRREGLPPDGVRLSLPLLGGPHLMGPLNDTPGNAVLLEGTFFSFVVDCLLLILQTRCVAADILWQPSSLLCLLSPCGLTAIDPSSSGADLCLGSYNPMTAIDSASRGSRVASEYQPPCRHIASTPVRLR